MIGYCGNNKLLLIWKSLLIIQEKHKNSIKKTYRKTAKRKSIYRITKSIRVKLWVVSWCLFKKNAIVTIET